VVLNQEIKAAQTVEVLLGLVVEHGERFNFINVSTAVNMVNKLASKHGKRVGRISVGKMLREDAGFAQLIDLVRLRCGAFDGQAIGNVLNRLAALHADLGVMSVDVRLSKQLVQVVEHVARNMKPQEVANTLNALGTVRQTESPCTGRYGQPQREAHQRSDATSADAWFLEMHERREIWVRRLLSVRRDDDECKEPQ
jgi:hypothetical protein